MTNDQTTTAPPKARGRRHAERGRQATPAARLAVAALIDQPPRRDRLLEYLHRLQDARGAITADALAALAEVMRLPLAEVYEVATFYAHLDVITDPAAVPPRLTVRVCDSVSCALAGAEALYSELRGALPPGVRVLRASCMGRCDAAPVVEVGRRHVTRADVPRIAAMLDGPAPAPVPGPRPEPLTTEDYRVLRRCLSGGLSREDATARVEDSGLRGLGGAGFPAARKWQFVRRELGPRYLAVNADEGEPGTFKDRHYLEAAPRTFLEGVLIAAWVIDAEAVYIYLRDEYPHLHEALRRELALLDGLRLRLPPIELRRGAGAYICGEESAMLESLEGKRGLPRHRPPYPAQVGLFGRPTLIHNVETLYWLPAILDRSAEAFRAGGRRGRHGLRTFSVSGRVKDPGVKLAPAGISVRELIEEFCGGMQDGHTFVAYLPGGASGGILPATLGDEPLDFGTLEQHGAFIGSAAIVVLSQQDSVREVAVNLMKFFAHESCGQCSPCRLGTEKAVPLMEESRWDRAALEDLARVLQDASICGLGQAAANPILSVLRHFPGAVS
ncbi:MAG: NADH-quinone oxidoreductase subunit F [Alphaproteobacteria bacterium]|nr:NADH-quinone oxidoreductase subunit F [Alphaproteobacteria bacterium]